ncbi:MAG: ABC transporter ATP-binding protein [Candidatus Bathyarchaeota archaeon]|nr:MAG: ABC transporter ATP-binding protein [Candidatus Bathyarchaeota archaeon]
MRIKTVDLTRKFHVGSSEIIAVNKVNMEVKESTFIAIVGPSGSGKSTLLNLLGLNDQPTRGKILLGNVDASLLPNQERRKIRLLCMGFVFQTFNLLPTLTALENVELPLALAGQPFEEQRSKATKLLESVALENRLHHRPKELSIGEMQRVAIARAIANDPKILLADEPTGELDSKTAEEIISLILDINKKQKTTTVVASHDLKIIEAADITYTIEDGKLELET